MRNGRAAALACVVLAGCQGPLPDSELVTPVVAAGEPAARVIVRRVRQQTARYVTWLATVDGRPAVNLAPGGSEASFMVAPGPRVIGVDCRLIGPAPAVAQLGLTFEAGREYRFVASVANFAVCQVALEGVSG